MKLKLTLALALASAAIAQQGQQKIVTLTPESSFQAFCMMYSSICQQGGYAAEMDMIGVQFPSVVGATEYDYTITAVDTVGHSMLVVSGVIRAGSSDGAIISTIVSMGRAFDPSTMTASVKAVGDLADMSSQPTNGVPANTVNRKTGR